jgi:quercetin dioxygenase-like cupin family protein
MKSANSVGVELRYGDWGPAYVMEGPRTLIGICHLRPGDVFENHYHRQHEETFFVLEGDVTLWMNCMTAHPLSAGDVHRCDPFEMHLLQNESGRLARFIFVKAPAVPGDKIDVPWRPGEPPPRLNEAEGELL